MNLKTIRLALRDIEQAAAYYRGQQVSLGEEFLSEIDAAIAAISAAPYQFEEFRPGMRRFLLDRFPYGVYYRMRGDDLIEIVVVKHHSRRPGLGMRRT
jgi:plasmid stabilization system protein ParE